MVGSGANYDEAYFEIKHLRTYTTAPGVVAPTAAFAHDDGEGSSAARGRWSTENVGMGWMWLGWVLTMVLGMGLAMSGIL